MLLAIGIFLVALAIALWGGRTGLRGLVVLAIVLALVAAIAVGCLVQRRPKLEDFPRPLLIGWVLIAVAVLLSFPADVVGLKLYGIGVAQYLVYPTFALAVWPLLEPGDTRRLSRLVIGLGLLVAVTVLLQAAGVEGFIQAASAQVDGLAANRYAGITGSYLHTSAFLGCTAVLMMGELTSLRDIPAKLGGTIGLAAILSGVVLTFSRSGVVISLIGVIALFAFAVAGSRRVFAAMVVPAIAIAIVAGSIGGVSPSAAGERVSSGFNPTKDAGNKLRTESFNKGFSVYGEATIPQQLIGRGVASTGNAQQLVNDSAPKVTVESYYLKLLVETGAIGFLLIGGFLVWAAITFALGAWKPPSAWAAGVVTAGLGLSLYNVIYPALETQVLALTWWLFLVLCLRIKADAAADDTPEPASGSSDEIRDPAPALAG